MSRGRKVLPATEQQGSEFISKTPASMAEQESRVAATQAAMEDALALGKAIGRIETAEFYETISASIKLAAFDEAKKSKAYLSMVNPETETYFRSLEEFCEVRLGASSRRIRQIADNRNLLRQETFEQSERLGLRQIDYNAIKALPAPKQEIIRQAIAEGSTREEIVQAIQELAAQDQNEIAALNEKVNNLEGTVQATERLLAERTKKLDELTVKKTRVKTEVPDDVLAALRHELAGFATSAEHELAGKVLPAMRAIIDHHAVHGGESSDILEGAMRQIERMAQTVRLECGLGEF